MDQIYKIKKIREDGAANRLKRRRRLFEEAKQLKATRCNDRDEYQAYRLRQEDLLFNGVKDQVISPKDLDTFKYKVSSLREHELNLNKLIQDAETECQNAGTAEKIARELYFKAFKNRTKIEEYNKIQSVQLRKMGRRIEEKEVEDLPFHSEGTVTSNERLQNR